MVVVKGRKPAGEDWVCVSGKVSETELDNFRSSVSIDWSRADPPFPVAKWASIQHRSKLGPDFASAFASAYAFHPFSPV